jgi:hypothetical protein
MTENEKLHPPQVRQEFEHQLLETLRRRHQEWKAASKENRNIARQSVQDALRAFDDFVLLGRIPGK